ncbi:MAG: FAD-dependent oxidoreductase [Eggerthellaceae bacterium]|nr:FAD-dependent oxidoreductase [Eggerthellaceae bacterium]
MPLSLDAALPECERLRNKEIARAMGMKPAAILSARLLKRSVDARKKANVHFVASFEVEVDDALWPGFDGLSSMKGVNVSEPKHAPRLDIPNAQERFVASGERRPVVVGTGPAGLFCALYLARAGMAPLVVERGSCVEERAQAIAAFDEGGALDVNTNIQFGEGGAGTFSDGKLNTGTKSPHIRHVLEEFVAAGAPEEILWQAKPHIGTDKLIDVVRNLRLSIIEAGGEVRFNTLMEQICLEGDGSDKCVCGVTLRDLRTGELSQVPTSRVILACGHSARDTFEMIHGSGFEMQRKPFAVGVRIEHPQDLMNRAQYGDAANHPALGAADYKLAVHTKSGRGVYTFCMCPGGEVVAAASEEGGVCVNGMSRFARDGRNANSALLVGIEPEDFPGDDVLAGVAFQREIERAAFELGCSSRKGDAGAPYTAPAQTVGDFLSKTSGNPSVLVKPTYPRGVAWRDLRKCLPSFVTDAMAEGLSMLDRKLAGFAHPQAVMTGVEARSSSPVRILRGENFQAHAGVDPSASWTTGLYPCGEGAGYAGGITSAAVDGLRVAEAVVAELVD